MRYVLGFLVLFTMSAWGQDNDSLSVLSCVGEQHHELLLSWVDDEALLTYYADDSAVATAKATDGYADQSVFYLPFLGTWYVFDEGKGEVSTGGNTDTCEFLLAPSERFDAEAVGFMMSAPQGGL